MGRQIIKQPNGNYCIFSSIVDNVTMYNLTEDEIIEEWVKEAKNKIVEDVRKITKSLNEGGQPYYQFTKSIDEMYETIKAIHGVKEMKEIRSYIDKAEK